MDFGVALGQWSAMSGINIWGFQIVSLVASPNAYADADNADFG